MHDERPGPVQDRGRRAVLCRVGLTGFEPAASSSRTRRATKLRHSPNVVRPERLTSIGAYRRRLGDPQSGSRRLEWRGDQREQGRLGAAGDPHPDVGVGAQAGRDVQPGRARVAGPRVGRVAVQAAGAGGVEVAVGGQRPDRPAGRPGRRGCGRRAPRRSRRRRTGRAPAGRARARPRAAGRPPGRRVRPTSSSRS